MSDKKWDFILEMRVRDYEIDMQGIVHHSVYINYLEHCRNSFVIDKGICIHEYHARGFDIVLSELNQKYKYPLRPRDDFYVTCNMGLQGKLRVVFEQEIRRKIDDKLILSADVVCVCLDIKTGRPCMPESLKQSFYK